MLEEINKKKWHRRYKIFMGIQKFLIKYRIVRNKTRQEYHIGWLAEGKTLEGLRMYLHREWGFGNHFVSWIDQAQVLNWRKLAEDNDQYHIRVFHDGEIRGHLEPTPESGLLSHMFKKGMREAQDEFIEFLGDFVVQDQVISDLKIDPDAYNPDAEISPRIQKEKKSELKIEI